MALDRERLLSGFLAAIKVCQVRYGGRTELATESDPRVAALCQCLEETLIHGLRRQIPSIGRTAIRQVAGLVSGLNLHLTLGANEFDKPVLWWYVKELLTRHECDRFLLLKNVQSDIGRGRAWLRSLLNEHSLERYIHILLTDQAFLELWYEPWALLRDQERAAMLPNLAAGLDSILFAINIDNETFNAGSKISSVDIPKLTEPEPLIVSTDICDTSKDQPSPNKSINKKRKKIASQVVSFDDDVLTTSGESAASTGCISAPSTLVNSPASLATSTPYSNSFDAALQQRQNDLIAPLEAMLVINECPSASRGQKRSPTSSLDGTSSPGLGLQSYESALEDLLSDASSTGIDRKLSSVKKIDIEAIYLSGQSSISEDSFNTTAENGGRSTLIPLKGGPSSLIPLSPDGESLFDFSGTDDVTSLKSSSQDEFENDDCKEGSRFSETSSVPVFPSSDSNKSLSMSPSTFSTLSQDDLRTAIFEISRARDLAQESRQEANAALTREIENSAALQAKLTHDQSQYKEVNQKTSAKIDALVRENELLRHQLKKYVVAVQMLHREGEDGSVLPSRKAPDLTDYHDEALAYENKLIQVAEMHAELMEFNERLQRLLKFRESQVNQLREELVDLRGPLPNEGEDFDETVSVTSDLDILSSPRTLINIWIPTAFLAGPSSDTHHVYQIYVRIKNDEWNVYRRFAQFYELHKRVRKKDPLVKTIDFPQKKTFGYKDINVVENRRIRLQKYLRKLVNLLVASNSKLATDPDKESLINLLPFISDAVEKKSSQKPPRKFLSRLSSSGRSDSSPPNRPNSPQYNGL